MRQQLKTFDLSIGIIFSSPQSRETVPWRFNMTFLLQNFWVAIHHNVAIMLSIFLNWTGGGYWPRELFRIHGSIFIRRFGNLDRNPLYTAFLFSLFWNYWSITLIVFFVRVLYYAFMWSYVGVL